MKQAEESIRDLLARLDSHDPHDHVSEEDLVEALKAKLLQSFRNGQKMCPRCNPKARGSRGPKKA